MSLLHFTDCHAQLLPIYFREPSVNLGVGDARGASRRISSAKRCSSTSASRPARATRTRSPISISTRAARAYGTMGGFAHLATLVKRLRASRPGALLLDGGDTWQGSATALWTQGPGHGRRAEAPRRRRDDRRTGSSRYGAERVQGNRRARTSPARSTSSRRTCSTADFGDPVFPPYVIRDDQRRAGRDHRPGVSVHADRESALLRRRVDVRHPGREPAEGRRRGARQGRAGRRAAVAQRHGRRPEARVARDAASTRSSAATRTTACRSRRSSRTAAAARSSPTPAATASSSACSTSTCKRRQGRRLPLPAAAGVLRTCCPPIRRWAR